jgi:ribose/xylose/arabinose/galactoside ABC-type transport system permease subunit
MGGSVWSAANALYYPAIWYLVVVVVFVYILEFTSWGNYIFATGSNALAAKALGVPVGRVKIGCFMLSSVLAGLAGCMILGYQSSADPSQGTDFEMFAIVAAVVGGTSLFGGSGSIAGSVIGSMIIAISGSGLVLVGAPAAWYQAFVGVILILAVIVNLRTSGLEASSLIRLIKGSPLTRRRTETAAPQ